MLYKTIVVVIFSLILFLNNGFRVVMDYEKITGTTVAWDQPQEIYETTGDISKPSLSADFFGRTHLVFSQSMSPFGEAEGDYVVFYSQLEEGEWLAPIDIVYDPRGNNASSSNLAVSTSGTGFISIHGYPGQTVLSGTSNATHEFGAVHAWKPPFILSSSLVTANSILATINDTLFIVYGDIGTPNNLYIISSTDAIVWSTPIQVSDNLPDQEAIYSTEIIQGKDGKIHVFWTTTAYPSGYPPQGTYHSYSIDAGKTWSEVTKIAEADVALAGATSYKDNIHVLLLGRAGYPGRFDVWSYDGGNSWSSPMIIDPAGDGLSGGDIVTDENGGVHAVFGSSTNQEVIYAYWDGSTWSQITNIAEGVPPTLEDIDLEIVNGNHLVATFVESHVRLWVVEAEIEDVTPTTPLQIPVYTPTLKVPESAGSVISPTSTSSPLLNFSESDNQDIGKSVEFPWISLLLPLAFITTVAILYFRRSR